MTTLLVKNKQRHTKIITEMKNKPKHFKQFIKIQDQKTLKYYKIIKQLGKLDKSDNNPNFSNDVVYYRYVKKNNKYLSI